MLYGENIWTIAIIGKNEHIFQRAPESNWWKTLFDFIDLFFRVPPGLFWDATTKMMMCLESWRSKYYFSSDGIHVPWFRGRNFSSKRSCSNYKNFFSGIRKSSRMAVKIKRWDTSKRNNNLYLYKVGSKNPYFFRSVWKSLEF